MDRRSWLWRRKSSEKSPGESESSGSVSSERFSDEQAYPIQSTQSPEVTSKAALNDDELHDGVKVLTQKLSAALLNISAKEDLVKQHSKVAEEAVSGWERAENEVLALKQQLDSANKKNSALEDRVSHLDGALKECVRQLRQAREDHEQKVLDIIAKKTREWESAKSVLESQLIEVKAQLETAKSETAINTDLRLKLDAAEKENSNLTDEILSLVKELEIRIIERDLSIKAAEAASKQHLDNIKKNAKLEAECRKLKAMVRKAFYDQKSFSASSFCVDSSIDSQSDNGERLLAVECEPSHPDSRGSSQFTKKLEQPKNGQNVMVTSVEIGLMDDFLEMERLAAMPDEESQSCYEAGTSSDNPGGNDNSSLKSQLETMIHRTAELEDKLEKMELEKRELGMALTEHQKQLETTKSRLDKMHIELGFVNKLKRAAEEEVEAIDKKREVAESQVRVFEAEVKTLISKVASLEEEVEKERELTAANVDKCRELEDELSRMRQKDEVQRKAEVQREESVKGELKKRKEKELAVASDKFTRCQKTIASLSQQLKSLASLEDFLIDFEQPIQLPGEGLHSHQNNADPHKLCPGA